jgi:hypothetical protein
VVFSFLIIYNLGMLSFFDYINPQVGLTTLKILFYASYVLIPAAALVLLWELYIDWRRAQFFAKQTYILLEIKVPREVQKSPRAMEFFISALYQTLGEGNWYEKYWLGQVRPWFSLEIVSFEGAIHFFVWTRKGFKTAIESNLYSQYPGIEIFEVPDYTLTPSFNPEENAMWASEFELTKADYFPIKTYVDYELDKNPDEEFKIDPLTPLIEFLGTLTRGNQVWIQLIIRAHKGEEVDPVTGKLVDLKWSKGAEKEIESIMEKAKGEKDPEGKFTPGTNRRLTEIESDTIKALSRSVSKPGFDVGIRTIYLANKDVFNPANIGGVIGGLSHFNSSLNGFKPARGSAEKYSNIFLLWKKRSEEKRNRERLEMMDAFKRRSYFFRPHKRPAFVLNAEELATMFHFPGGVATTPTFTRVDSRKGEAPANIPT